MWDKNAAKVRSLGRILRKRKAPPIFHGNKPAQNLRVIGVFKCLNSLGRRVQCSMAQNLVFVSNAVGLNSQVPESLQSS